MKLFTSLGQFLTRRDIFGHKVEMHYKGKPTYRTKLGGILSLAVYIIVTIETVNLGIFGFLDHSAQKEQYVRIRQDLMKQNQTYNLEDEQFQIYYNDFSNGIYPPEVGRWQAKLMTKNYKGQ